MSGSELTIIMNQRKNRSSFWGEPERAPYKRSVREISLSVCLMARTFINDNLQM